MSGSISLKTNQNWVKAGWVYRSALENILDVLKEKNPSLYEELSEESSNAQAVQYIDFEYLGKEKSETIASVVAEAYELAKVKGPKDWKDPSFYPQFLESFKELVEDIKEKH